MFKLNNKLIVAGVALTLTSALFMTGCGGADTDTASAPKASKASTPYDGTKNALDGGMTYPRANGVETAYRYNTKQMTKLNYEIGRAHV